MWRRLGIATRIGVTILVTLTVVTAAVSGYVLATDHGTDVSSAADAKLSPTSTSAASTQPDASARSYVQNALRTGLTTQGYTWPEQHLSDLLPNVTYVIDGAEARPLAIGIVVGTITDVTAGGAYSSPAATPMPFASPDAAARVFVLHLAVEQGMGAAAGLADVAVGLKLAGDVDPAEAIAGLKAFGRVVVVCDTATTFFFDPALPEVRRSGQLLGTVDADGLIDFPFLGTDSASFVDSLSTVDELVAASAQPTTTRTIVNGAITAP